MNDDIARLRLYVPRGVRPTRADWSGPADVHECVRAMLGEHAGGWTEWQAAGGWINDDGETVREEVRVYECTAEHARTLARYLASTVVLATEETEVRAEVTPVAHVETQRATNSAQRAALAGVADADA